MTLSFFFAAVFVTLGATCAVLLRNLIHCALALALALTGVAAIYLQLDAQFAGFAQVLVYLGAVAILILFAILLTGGGQAGPGRFLADRWWWGAGLASVFFGVTSFLVLRSPIVSGEAAQAQGRSASTRELGELLMSRYVVPLEIIGLLLTVALIGAVVLARPSKEVA